MKRRDFIKQASVVGTASSAVAAPAIVRAEGGNTVDNCAPPIESEGRDSRKNQVSNCVKIHCLAVIILAIL